MPYCHGSASRHAARLRPSPSRRRSQRAFEEGALAAGLAWRSVPLDSFLPGGHGLPERELSVMTLYEFTSAAQEADAS